MKKETLRLELLKYQRFFSRNFHLFKDGDNTVDMYLNERFNNSIASVEPEPLLKNKYCESKKCMWDDCDNGLILDGPIARKCSSCI